MERCARGAPADLTLLEFRQGSFDFSDNEKSKRTGRETLFPYAVVVGVRRVS